MFCRDYPKASPHFSLHAVSEAGEVLSFVIIGSESDRPFRGRRLAQLVHHSSRRRVDRGVEVQDAPTAVVDDEECLEESDRCCGPREEVHRGDGVLVVTQRGDPALHLVGHDGPAPQLA